MGDRRRLRAQRRGTWTSIGDAVFPARSRCTLGVRRNIAEASLGVMRIVAGSGRKDGRPLFAVRDGDDGRVRVDGPDIQPRFAHRKPGRDMQMGVHRGGSIVVL